MSDLTLVDVARRRLQALPHLWVDGVLAGAITVVQLWPLISSASSMGGSWHWWGYVVAIAASLPLVWRRRAPVTVLVVSLCTSELYDLADDVARQPIWYGVLVGFYTVAAYSSRAPRIIVLILTCAGTLLTAGSWDTLLRGTVQVVAAYAIGRAAATSRAHAAALEERTARLERERQTGWKGNARWKPSAPPSASGPGSPATCTTSWPTRSA
ncbi:DUF7134 domain-containing protein [Nonomuraea turkmeniaca]|uniref:DUF7134 domain-containing protein n=1 Tax=Nonomuraea turkmeniaca TaxID=103838 RepID=UPI001B86FA5A|nr:hypothetical protein [Nonomuraea turkmeniaca]